MDKKEIKKLKNELLKKKSHDILRTCRPYEKKNGLHLCKPF